MITINLMQDDLLKMRFAYRPLIEISLSYRVLINSEFQTSYRRWVDDAQRALNDIELPYLQALVPPRGYAPDFLTPTPSSAQVNIHDDIQALLATPDEAIRANIQTLINEYGETEIRCFFLAHPREAIQRLAAEMQIYWQRTLADYWQRMISVLEGDLLYHGRVLALDGPDVMFGDLHPTVGYCQNQILIEPVCQYMNQPFESTLAGDGIQLVPSVFGGCGRMFLVDSPWWQPMLAYRIRGAGLWYRQPISPTLSLELAMGTGRASVLQALTKPATTGELAHRLQVTSSAISQHIKRLALAGLVEPHRNGKRVYYCLTQRGEDLIALFERIY